MPRVRSSYVLGLGGVRFKLGLTTPHLGENFSTGLSPENKIEDMSDNLNVLLEYDLKLV